jgi:competence protein ComEA
VLASRILRFRNALGGFTQTDQLFDVFGLSKEAVLSLQESSFIADDFLPEQINLNFANRGELAKHPYIDQVLARKIVEFRDKMGPIRDHDKLEAAHLMDDSLFFKLKPYVTF